MKGRHGDFLVGFAIAGLALAPSKTRWIDERRHRHSSLHVHGTGDEMSLRVDEVRLANSGVVLQVRRCLIASLFFYLTNRPPRPRRTVATLPRPAPRRPRDRRG